MAGQLLAHASTLGPGPPAHMCACVAAVPLSCRGDCLQSALPAACAHDVQGPGLNCPPAARSSRCAWRPSHQISEARALRKGAGLCCDTPAARADKMHVFRAHVGALQPDLPDAPGARLDDQHKVAVGRHGDAVAVQEAVRDDGGSLHAGVVGQQLPAQRALHAGGAGCSPRAAASECSSAALLSLGPWKPRAAARTFCQPQSHRKQKKISTGARSVPSSPTSCSLRAATCECSSRGRTGSYAQLLGFPFKALRITAQTARTAWGLSSWGVRRV